MFREIRNLSGSQDKDSWIEKGQDPSLDTFTGKIHDETVTQLSLLKQQLSSRGLNAKIGLEIEIGLESKPKDVKAWSLLKTELINQTSDTNAISFLKNATPAEIVIYQLYQSDLRDFLNPAFGHTYNSNLIYDNDGVIEIQTIPLDIETLPKVRENIIANIMYYSQGLEINEENVLPPNYHLNLSFDDTDGNLFNPSHPKFLTFGKSLAEGITYSLSRSAMFLYDESDFSSARAPDNTLSPGRQSGFRFNTNRVEIKFGFQDEGQDVELVSMLAVAGALYGYDNTGKNSDIVPAQVVDSLASASTSSEFNLFCHVLNGSYINSNQYLIVDQKYVNTRLKGLLFSTGVTDHPPQNSALENIFELFMRPEELDPMITFLQNISVSFDDGEAKLVFPQTEPGYYDFVIPEAGMEKIPVEVQSRIRAGYELTHEEADKFILPGQRIPTAAVHKKIDIIRLEKGTTLIAIVPKFIVFDPVAGQPKKYTNNLEAVNYRISNFKKNKSLVYLDREYSDKLRDLVGDYGEKTVHDFID